MAATEERKYGTEDVFTHKRMKDNGQGYEPVTRKLLNGHGSGRPRLAIRCGAITAAFQLSAAQSPLPLNLILALFTAVNGSKVNIHNILHFRNAEVKTPKHDEDGNFAWSVVRGHMGHHGGCEPKTHKKKGRDGIKPHFHSLILPFNAA
jgi:hypothetical protein